MRVLKALQLDRNDTQDIADLRDIEESCNKAAAFFFEDRLGARDQQERGEGLRAIRVLSGGHPFELKHIQAALDEVNTACVRLRRTEPHQFLPAELKEQYIDDLSRVTTILLRWRRMVE